MEMASVTEGLKACDPMRWVEADEHAESIGRGSYTIRVDISIIG